jgi:ABC-type sulfate/molybdate transport systems ATPase subunit
VNVAPAKRRIGVVFQDYALFPHMTVAENVAFGLHELGEAERRARVREELDRMRIGELANRYPKEISGGQRQRVAIARCMAIEPGALLLDEPFAALDPHLRRQMEEQLRETLRSYNGVVIFVTHDMEEAFRFCSELLVLDGGRVIAEGEKHALFEQPRSVITARLTGCKNIARADQMVAGHIAVEAWDCELSLAGAQEAVIRHVGYRSHHFRFQQNAAGENVFPCWLVETSEAPHEMTLYLRLHRAPEPGDGPHLQADISKEQWRALNSEPQPWRIQIVPERLLLLED